MEKVRLVKNNVYKLAFNERVLGARDEYHERVEIVREWEFVGGSGNGLRFHCPSIGKDKSLSRKEFDEAYRP